MPIRLTFEGGTIAIAIAASGSTSAPTPARARAQAAAALPPDLAAQPWVEWDVRSHSFRALAFRYPRLVERLRAWAKENPSLNPDVETEVEDRVLKSLPPPVVHPDPESPLKLRDYQGEALERWLSDGEGQGVVVLPTGAGKTYVALGALLRLRCAAFIVVPTLDLVDQWKRTLSRFIGPVGELTGRQRRTESVTVATYDSAYIHADRLGNRFPLIIFDEVHHLPSPGYRHIAEFFASPYRLGLTATYEREDERHEALADLLGGKVFEVSAGELSGRHLAPYTLERLYVELTPQERRVYEQAQRLFQGYVRKRRLRLRGPRDFERLIYRSGADPEAWRAVRARHRAVQIAFNAREKLEELRRLLERHRGDRILIFTRYNELVYRISEEFFIPCITYKTDRDERTEILEGFRDGVYPAIASSQVLDEGVDVPEANVGIILSGTGSSREFIQRLGRLLRPQQGKRAILYELVSRGTGEERTASRRKRKLKGSQRGKG